MIAVVRPLDAGLPVFGLLSALAPNVHYWYVTWLVPFLCFRPSRGWLLFCGTVAVSYFTFAHYARTGDWVQWPWVQWSEYLPVYLLLAADWLLARRRSSASGPGKSGPPFDNPPVRP